MRRRNSGVGAHNFDWACLGFELHYGYTHGYYYPRHAYGYHSYRPYRAYYARNYHAARYGYHRVHR